MQRFTSERDLQTYCKHQLQGRGIRVQEEVPVGGLRADLVTPEAVIECKLVLDREGIYQGLGQATAYNRQLQRKEIWLVGQLPLAITAQQQARNIAAQIERDSDIYISFLEEDEYWHDSSANGSGISLLQVMGLILGGCLLGFSLANYWQNKKCDPQTSLTLRVGYSIRSNGGQKQQNPNSSWGLSES